MKKRLLYILLCAALLAVAALTAFTLPASAEKRTIPSSCVDRPGRAGHRRRPAGHAARPDPAARRAGRPRPRPPPRPAAARRRPSRAPPAPKPGAAEPARRQSSPRRQEGRGKKDEAQGKDDGDSRLSLEVRLRVARPKRQAPQGRTPAAQPRRLADARRTPASSTRCPGPSIAHGRPELRDPQVPGAGVPAADLPGRRASSTACAGRSWRRSTRSRPTTAATSTSPPPARWAGCSSSPRPGGPTASTRTRTARRTPTTPSTRSSPPPATSRPPATRRTSAARSSPTTTPTGTSTRVMLRARLIAGVPADLVGSLTGLTEGRFPVAARARYADDLQEARGHQARQARPERRQRRRVQGRPPRDRDLRPAGRAGGRHQRRRDQEDRRLREARPLRRAPGRLRQPLHATRGLGSVAKYYPVPKEDADRPEAVRQGAQGQRRRQGPKPTTPASAGRQPDRRRLAPASQRAEGQQGRRRRARAAPRCPSRSACSPTPTRRSRASPAASSSCSTRRRAKGGFETYKNYFSRPFGADAKDVRLRRLKGARA